MECAQTDGMSILYQSLEWADVIIFGTPIYCFGPSAQTKLLIDRFRPYFANKKLYGKRAALLLTAGADIEDCDLTIEMFKRIFKALGIKYIDAIALSGGDEVVLGQDEKQHDQIRDLIDRIMEEEIAWTIVQLKK